MPVRKETSQPLNQWVEQAHKRQVEAIIDILGDVGLEAVRKMRDERIYTDRTNNLRSSTGYAVIYGGRVVRGGTFEPVTDGNNGAEATDGSEGVEAGQTFLQEIIQEEGEQYPILVLMAGMNYAYYVERLGYNVMDSAIDHVRQAVPEMIEAIGIKAK